MKGSGSSVEWNADPNAPNRFPFGRVGGAGNIIHNATFGPDKMYVGFVGILGASGPINRYIGFKADDEVVTFNGAGMAVTSDFANEMWLIRQRGTQPESAALTSPAGLKHGATLPNWGSSYKLSGKAAYMYVLGENSKRSAYQGKVPTGIHTFEGLLCYDPRLDSTYPGGSGSCRLNDPSTWVYSTNSYIQGLNWAIGRWEGLTDGAAGAPYASMKVGGIGARPDGIDFETYVEAANIFDANAWASAGWPDADQSKGAVLDSFLQAGGGIYAERRGRISCMHRAAPRTSIATITADDTAGTIEYDTTTSLLERINTIRPQYWSEAHGWQMVATEEVTSSVWREEDGQGVAITKSKGQDYNYVPGSKQSRELAALQIAHTREGIRGTAPLRHYLDLEPGDCIDFDVPDAVLNGQKVLILNVDPDLEADVIHVTFASESDGKYAFAFGQADAPPPVPAIIPSTPDVSPPAPTEWAFAAETLTEGGSAVPALVFGGAVDNPRAEQVIFEYRVVDTPEREWSGAGIEDPNVIRKEVTSVTSDTAYEGAVSYRIGNRISNRLPLGPVTTGAAVTPPAGALANVTGTPALSISTTIATDGTEASLLTASWTAVTGASSYDIEIDDGAGGWFESSPVASLKNIRVRTGLTYRVRIKAANRDGVRSAAWSAWSASVAAGGDTTPPGVITASSVTALARRCVLTWTNPTAADFSHVRLYRNITGAAHTEADLYAVRVEGSTYTDTNVQAAVTYYYAIKTVDRTGNIGEFKFVGAGTPTYIQAGGGGGVYPDIAPTDPMIVTEFGTSALVFGQGPGATAPGAQVMNNRTEGDTTFIALPEGGAKVGASSQTGAVKIILPAGAVGAGKDSMVQMFVDIYEYGASASTTYALKGYTFNGGSRFMNVSAQLLGARSVTRPVRFGFDAVLGRFCIWIGEPGGAWSYPNVRLRDVTVGYSNFAEATWRAGWQVEFNTGTQTYNPSDVVALPRAGDTVFGEGVFEVAGGAVATRPNFRTDQGVAALVAGQSLLATLNVPTYASNGAAISDGQSNGLAFYNTTSGMLETVVRTPGDSVGSIFATPGLNTTVSGASASWTLAGSKDVASVPAGATLDPMVDAPGGGTSANPSASANFVFRLTEQLVSGGTEVTITEGDITIVSGDLALPGGGYQVSASAMPYARYLAATKSGSVRYRLYIKGHTFNDTSLATSFTSILRIFNP